MTVKNKNIYLVVKTRAKKDLFFVSSGLVIAFVSSLIFGLGYSWASWTGVFGIAFFLTGLQGIYDHVKFLKGKEEYSVLASKANAGFLWVVVGMLIHVMSSVIYYFGYSLAELGCLLGLLVTLTGLRCFYSYIKMIPANSRE